MGLYGKKINKEIIFTLKYICKNSNNILKQDTDLG